MGALAGLRVIEVGSGLAGSLVGMILSDHGAEVIKVEPPHGDALRSYPGSVVWLRGRRSVVGDLDDEAARSWFGDLVASADVLIESFEPGRMDAWGLGYEVLSGELPGLIYCSLTGYGRGTSSSDRPDIDLLVQARTGQQWEQPGWREGPIYLYAPLPSFGASFMALNGILAALHAREVTGRGQWVETSLHQGVLAITTQLWQDVERPGDNFWGIPMNPQMNVFECSDGLWVHSMYGSGGRGRDRSALFRILDLEPFEFQMITDPAAAAATEAKVRAAVGKIPRERLLAEFWANDFAIAPVLQAHEAFEIDQLVHNGMIVTVDDPVEGPTRQAGITFNLHGAPPAVVQGPRPLLGADTDTVIAELAAAPGPDRRAAAERRGSRPLNHALEGIKVLDLGNFLAGPFGPMLLGDLGATVYKLESPDGDQMRFVTKPFNGCQRGKLDVVADLKTPEGLEIAHRLIREVDVVHHNMRPGVAERLGIDYEMAKRLNPSVIYCQTTMWGIDGPRRDWPGFDQLGQASCGCEYELGGDGNPPVWYRFGMCDQVCACQSAVAVLMALYWRDLTGEGQFVDTSIINGGMFLNSDVWIGDDGPHVRPRLDARQTGISPLYRLYETADGWLALAVLNEAHWAALATVFPELGTDPQFADATRRQQNAAALGAIMETRLASESAATWWRLLDAAGVPVEISDPTVGSTWFDDPTLVAAGLVADYEHPTYGRFRQFGQLVHLSGTPGRIAGPPPLLGEHSSMVLTELGYSPDEIADLAARRVTVLASG